MTNTLRAKNIPLPLRDVYNSVFQINKFHDLTSFVTSIHLLENKFKQGRNAMLWIELQDTQFKKKINAFEYKVKQKNFLFPSKRNHCSN